MPKISFGGLFPLCRPKKLDANGSLPFCFSLGKVEMASALMAVREINNKTDTFHDDLLKNHVVSATCENCKELIHCTCIS